MRVEITRLSWDSDFWGRRVGRVCISDAPDEPALFQTAMMCAVQEFDFLQMLVPLADLPLVQAAEDLGFRLVDVRCVVTRSLVDEHGERHLLSADRRRDLQIGEVSEQNDVVEVAAVASRCHGISRFASDPLLESERTAEMYRQWVLRDAGQPGWTVGALRRAGATVGYVTFGLGLDGAGSIGLVGVDALERGNGIGRALVQYAMDECRARGATSMNIVTQAGNEPALAVYRSLGFQSLQFGAWMHWHSSTPVMRARASGPCPT